jgi:hypothetical protein
MEPFLARLICLTSFPCCFYIFACLVSPLFCAWLLCVPFLSDVPEQHRRAFITNMQVPLPIVSINAFIRCLHQDSMTDFYVLPRFALLLRARRLVSDARERRGGCWRQGRAGRGRIGTKNRRMRAPSRLTGAASPRPGLLPDDEEGAPEEARRTFEARGLWCDQRPPVPCGQRGRPRCAGGDARTTAAAGWERQNRIGDSEL